jgi:hypothetical protein
LRTIAWVKNIPGGFITSNNSIAAIKIWNVAQKKPSATRRVGQTGILNMIALDYTILGYDAFLMTFNNGSIGIFNFKTKKLDYLSQ